jgi:hypothetical protein
MSHEKVGPKEAALRAMRETRNDARNKPQSASDLRKHLAKIKTSTKNPAKRRGR